MADVLIDALAAKYRLALQADSAAVAFVDPADSLTPPVGAFDLAPHGNIGFAALRFAPIGVGAPGTMYNIRLTGWREVILDPTKPGAVFYHPEPMYLATVTLGSMVSLANELLGGSHVYAETIAVITPPTNDNVSSETISADTAGGSAHFVQDMKGCRYATVEFMMGTATSGNALLAPF